MSEPVRFSDALRGPDGSNFWTDQTLYDRCCGSRPRIVETPPAAGAKKPTVSAYCDSCGAAVESKLPVEIVTAWNIQRRTEKKTA